MSARALSPEQAEELFYFDDTLSEAIESWMVERCGAFVNDNPEGADYSLHQTEIFHAYCEYLSLVLEGLLSNNGIDTVKFYEELRAQLDGCKTVKQRNSTFSSMVLSSIDFSTFCSTMNDVRCGRGFCFVPPLVDCDELSMELADEKYTTDADTDGLRHQSSKLDYPADAKAHYSDHAAPGDKGYAGHK